MLPIIHRPDGEFYAEGALYETIKPAAVRAGLKDMVVHEFRHSCVTHCLRAGCTVAETAAFVDMSERMVRDVYGHFAEEGTERGALAMADKSVKPEFTSRELANMKPRSQMRPTDVTRGRRDMTVRHRPQTMTIQ